MHYQFKLSRWINTVIGNDKKFFFFFFSSSSEAYLYKGGTFSAGLAVISSGEGGWTDGSDTVISIFCRNIKKNGLVNHLINLYLYN